MKTFKLLSYDQIYDSIIEYSKSNSKKYSLQNQLYDEDVIDEFYNYINNLAISSCKKNLYEIIIYISKFKIDDFDVKLKNVNFRYSSLLFFLGELDNDFKIRIGGYEQLFFSFIKFKDFALDVLHEINIYQDIYPALLPQDLNIFQIENIYQKISKSINSDNYQSYLKAAASSQGKIILNDNFHETYRGNVVLSVGYNQNCDIFQIDIESNNNKVTFLLRNKQFFEQGLHTCSIMTIDDKGKENIVELFDFYNEKDYENHHDIDKDKIDFLQLSDPKSNYKIIIYKKS